MAVVDPQGKHEEVGRLLLDLAAESEQFDPSVHVQTTTDGPSGFAYVVPDELHQMYLDAISGGSAEAGETEGHEEPESATPALKRRGRPPKNRTV